MGLLEDELEHLVANSQAARARTAPKIGPISDLAHKARQLIARLRSLLGCG